MNTLEQLRADYEALGQRIERMEKAEQDPWHGVMNITPEIADDLLKMVGANIENYPKACRSIAVLACKAYDRPAEGEKIDWIKWHREMFGSSLVEAKNAADAAFSRSA